MSNPGPSAAVPAHRLNRPSPTTADKVRFLGIAASYPHGPGTVRVEETHMSWVFLAGSRVYKLKKPVRYPFLDFSTLEAREHFVSEEGRLNRRLAPDVYLGATPLSVDEDGRMILGEADQVVDWLVTMRRLPEDRMLDRLITANALTADTVERLSDRLGAFFAAASAEYPDPAAFVDRYRREQAITSDVLLDPELGFDGARIGPLLERFTESFDQVRPHLEARLSAGRIVEGHGDLRPEHVFLSRSIAIIDCLEFNRDLRLLDPFEELAFLGLECARLGADWVFPLLYRRCAESLDDRPPTDVIAFYWRYRALLRARLSLAHLFEAKPRTPEKWRPLAWRYVVLAERDTVEIIRLDG